MKMYGDTIEITIRDSSHKKLEYFKANLLDKKLCNKIISIIEHKYNLVCDKSKDNNRESKDADWLDMNNRFFQ